MADTEKDVNATESSPDVKADAKGVPWENRAKEFERKYEEQRLEFEDMKARMANLETPVRETSKEDEAAEGREKLQQLVKDPDAYIERRLMERELQRELPAAESWVRSQPDFMKEDEIRLAQIIKEHGLSQPSPMLRAKSAYRILKAEKLEREFVDKTRQSNVQGAMLEGSGRAAPKKDGPSRNDLLNQLRDAEKSGDILRSAMLVTQLGRTPKGN